MDWIMALAATPWVFLVLFAFCVLDGFFPPVPSESAVIALATLWASHGTPSLVWIWVAAALGAFCGDHVAYAIGRRVPLHRLPGMGGPRGERLLATTRSELRKRGATYLFAARFIPVGRVAVNLTCGYTHFSLRRFTPLIALASAGWATYSIGLGVAAGAFLGHNPLLAVVVGVVGGVLIGLAVDWVVRRFMARRDGAVDPAADPAADSAAASEPS